MRLRQSRGQDTLGVFMNANKRNCNFSTATTVRCYKFTVLCKLCGTFSFENQHQTITSMRKSVESQMARGGLPELASLATINPIEDELRHIYAT